MNNTGQLYEAIVLFASILFIIFLLIRVIKQNR